MKASDKYDIVHVVPGEPFGGAQLIALSLVEAQRRSGLKACLVITNASSRVALIAANSEMPLITLRGSRVARAARLLWFLRKSEPPVIHTHCEPLWAIPSIAATTRSAWVAHVHVYPSRARVMERAANLLRKSGVRHFVAASKSLASAVVDAGVAETSRVTVVYNGRDIYDAPCDIPRVRPGKFTLGFIGRIEPEKGTSILPQLAEELAKDGFKFLIAGEGSALRDLKAQVNDRGLQDHFTFRRFTPDLAPIWAEIDLFLMLSEKEPFGLVVLEALAHGVPVLGIRNESGGREIIELLDGSYLADRTPSALAAEIRRIASEQKLVKAEVSRGSAQVRKQFNVDRMRRGVDAVYARLASKR